jgi:hypothetical protein
VGEYTAFADLSGALIKLLQAYLVPDTVRSVDSIGLCSPADHGDFLLGVHLYSIEECAEIRETEMVSRGLQQQQYPPSYYQLYYMITPYSTSSLKFRAEEEQRILGRVAQVIRDYGFFDRETYHPVSAPKGLDVRMEWVTLTTEEKLKIWNVPDAPYRTSLFYKALPVAVASTKMKRIRRVTGFDLSVNEKEQP